MAPEPEKDLKKEAANVLSKVEVELAKVNLPERDGVNGESKSKTKPEDLRLKIGSG